MQTHPEPKQKTDHTTTNGQSPQIEFPKMVGRNLSIDRTLNTGIGMFSLSDVPPGVLIFEERTYWVCPVGENLANPSERGHDNMMDLGNVFPSYNENLHGTCAIGILACMMMEREIDPFKNHDIDLSEGGWCGKRTQCTSGRCVTKNTDHNNNNNNINELHRLLTQVCKVVKSPISKEELSVAYFPIVSHINHSCNPNAELVLDVNCARLFSKKPILAGEEITISYLPYDLGEELSNKMIEWARGSCNCSSHVTETETIESLCKKLSASFINSEYYSETQHHHRDDDDDAKHEELIRGFSRYVTEAYGDQLTECTELKTRLINLLGYSPNLVGAENKQIGNRFAEELWTGTLVRELTKGLVSVADTKEKLRLWLLILLECCCQLLCCERYDLFAQAYLQVIKVPSLCKGIGAEIPDVVYLNDKLLISVLGLAHKLFSSAPGFFGTSSKRPIKKLTPGAFMNMLGDCITQLDQLVPTKTLIFSDNILVKMMGDVIQ